MKIDLHFPRDEKGEAHDRPERVLDVVERIIEPAAGQARNTGHFARRLERGKHVSGCLGIESVGIEEVGPREQVEHGGALRRHIGIRPGADFGKLALLEMGEGIVEESGVALPGAVPGQWRQRRIGGGLKPCEKPRGVVGGHHRFAPRRHRDCKKQSCSDSCHSRQMMHLMSGPQDTVRGSANLWKMA